MSHLIFYWSLFSIIGSWVIRIVMLVVVILRNRAGTAMGWLVVIFFVPWLGLVLYLLIGENTLPRHRIERYRRLKDHFRDMRREFVADASLVRPKLDSRLDTTVAVVEHLTRMPVLGGNDAILISDTNEFIDCLIEDIDRAEHAVHLMFFIFANDATGARVADALIRAVGRGVTCRVLVDAVGSLQMLRSLGTRLAESGVIVRQALPVSLFRFYMARIDLRNHRKIVVIDGTIAYTGSQNIVDAGYGHRDLAWHDIMVRLTGPAVIELQGVFVGDWYTETGVILDGTDIFPLPRVTGTLAVQALPSGPTDPTENYQNSVVTALYAARQRVTLTTPYFVPDEAFRQALAVAALRGVEVNLIVPRTLDQRLVVAASRAYFDELLEAGVTIYLYERGLLHAKSMCIDDVMAFIGTSNLDIRSFSLNFEINLVFFGGPFIAALSRLHDEYRANATPIDPDEWRRRPVRKKLAQNVAKLLSPIL